jgi:hypothetical protein
MLTTLSAAPSPGTRWVGLKDKQVGRLANLASSAEHSRSRKPQGASLRSALHFPGTVFTSLGMTRT